MYLYMEEVKYTLVTCTGYMCVLYSLHSFFFGLLFSTCIFSWVC